MTLTKGKHIVQEIDGVLCTVVESGVNAERLKFLKELLEFNKFVVKSAEVTKPEEQTPSFIIGVADLVFNPVIAVFEQSLKLPNGKRVSPSHWNQTAEVEHLPYFDYRDKNANAVNEDDFQPNPWAYRTI